MAKSKNAAQHHQNRKDHRNGIKKPKTHRHKPLKGMDQKFLLNHKYAVKGTLKAQNQKSE